MKNTLTFTLVIPLLLGFTLTNLHAQEENQFCTAQYDPVCGKKDTGIRCITIPCPSSENKTFGNMCELTNAEAEFLYEGECTKDREDGAGETPKEPVVIDSEIQAILDQIESVEKKIEDLNKEIPELEKANSLEKSQSWLSNFLSKMIGWITFWK